MEENMEVVQFNFILMEMFITTCQRSSNHPIVAFKSLIFPCPYSGVKTYQMILHGFIFSSWTVTTSYLNFDRPHSLGTFGETGHLDQQYCGFWEGRGKHWGPSVCPFHRWRRIRKGEQSRIGSSTASIWKNVFCGLFFSFFHQVALNSCSSTRLSFQLKEVFRQIFATYRDLHVCMYFVSCSQIENLNRPVPKVSFSWHYLEWKSR